VSYTIDEAVPPKLRKFRRYTIGEVAAMLNVSAHYLWQCVRAARDERFRIKRKVSFSTLRSLPIMDWFKQGREWMIAEDDLLRQLTPRQP
jgi:hypothetical protein